MANANEQTLVKQIVGVDYDFPTVSDLTLRQYTFVKLDADELVVVPSAGDAPIGILQNAPLGAAGAVKYATVRLLGISKLLLAATVVTALPFLKTDGNGAGITVAADKDIYGAVAKSGGVSGDYIIVSIGNGTYSAT